MKDDIKKINSDLKKHQGDLNTLISGKIGAIKTAIAKVATGENGVMAVLSLIVSLGGLVSWGCMHSLFGELKVAETSAYADEIEENLKYEKEQEDYCHQREMEFRESEQRFLADFMSTAMRITEANFSEEIAQIKNRDELEKWLKENGQRFLAEFERIGRKIIEELRREAEQLGYRKERKKWLEKGRQRFLIESESRWLKIIGDSQIKIPQKSKGSVSTGTPPAPPAAEEGISGSAIEGDTLSKDIGDDDGLLLS